MVFPCRQVIFSMVFSIREPTTTTATTTTPATTTTMGFRSYIRHFRGAILGLLRPSEAWCFPAGRWFFPWCFPSGNQQQQQQKSVQQQEEKVSKMHSSSKRKKQPYYDYWPLRLLRLLRLLLLLRLLRLRLLRLLLLLLLLWVSEVTLGIFGVQFWGFSVLQRHGVSLPAGDFFHGVFHPGTNSSSKNLCSSRRKR